MVTAMNADLSEMVGVGRVELPTSGNGRVCLVLACKRRRRSLGFCKKHYARWKATGNPVRVRACGRPRKHVALLGETSPAALGRRLGIPRQRADRLLYPEQWAARQAVAQALIKGKLVTPDACERCGDSAPLQAHHADYGRPLDVAWLCRPCHNIVHPHAPGSRQRRRRAA